MAQYMQAHGYRIVPVNPRYDEVLGERCYPSLTDIPHPVDLVDLVDRRDRRERGRRRCRGLLRRGLGRLL